MTLNDLAELMAELRDPEHGCPWDKKQTLESLASFAVEEAYEVQAAAEAGDWDALKGELGDLLFQVVFYSQLAREAGQFELSDVVRRLHDKLVSRHPHVWPSGQRDSFGEPTELTETQVAAQWEALKTQERAARGETGLLDDIPMALPELQRAEKLQKRAAKIGFDWSEPEPVFAKVEEELEEVRQAKNDQERLDEIGDVLFSVVNLARHFGVDPAAALRRTNRKFVQRFHLMEDEGALTGLDLAELEARWLRAKRRLRDK